MNTSMFLFVALVLCAVPSALGQAFCNQCRPNVTAGALCNSTGDLMRENCTSHNSTCYRTSIMGSNSRVYVFGCNNMATCTGTNTTICGAAQLDASNAGLTINMCDTVCSSGNGSNELPMMVYPSPSSTMAMATATIAGPTPVTTMKPSSVERLRPTFLGVLFFILVAILRQ